MYPIQICYAFQMNICYAHDCAWFMVMAAGDPGLLLAHDCAWFMVIAVGRLMKIEKMEELLDVLCMNIHM